MYVEKILHTLLITSALYTLNVAYYTTFNVNSVDLIELTYTYREFRLNYYNGPIDSSLISSHTRTKTLIVVSSIITEIENNALCSAPFPEIEFNSNHRLPKLTKNHFENCSTLMSLKLIYNNNLSFEDTVFLPLTNLQKLEIVGQNIKSLSKKYFATLGKLKELTVNSCGVEWIEPGAFDSLRNLTTLRLRENRLTEANFFYKLKMLESLFLDSNKLTSFPWDYLAYVKHLQILSITSNRISRYDTEKLVKHCPKLQQFYFKFNIFECGTVKKVVEVMKTNFPDLRVDYKTSEFKYCNV